MNGRIEQAIRKLKAGDAGGIESALESLTASAFAFARKVCGNAQDAEDIAQETMIQLTRSVHRFPDAKGLGVWLYKVAKTRCLMSRRRSKFAPAQTLSLDDLMPTHGGAAGTSQDGWPQNPEELVLRQELRDQLERAVLDLPEPYRLVLVLRDMEELSTEEVARILGVSEATVKMRLHRARVFVRNSLDRHLQLVAAEVRNEG
jgi:RNA polymerase sigma-70 factor, ECF subfamily